MRLEQPDLRRVPQAPVRRPFIARSSRDLASQDIWRLSSRERIHIRLVFGNIGLALPAFAHGDGRMTGQVTTPVVRRDVVPQGVS